MSELSFMDFKALLGLLFFGGALAVAIWLRIDAVRALRDSKTSAEPEREDDGSERRSA